MAPRDVVLSLVNALNAEELNEARRLVHDDMQFVGVLGTRDGAGTARLRSVLLFR